MSKPKKNTGVEISLFPFLSILACIIGCLTMVIVALSIIQANNDGREPEEVQRAKQYLELEKLREEEGKKVDELKQKIEEIVLTREELNEKREELKVIETEMEKAKDVDSLRDELIAELNRLKQQVVQLGVDYEDLLAQIEELKKQLKDNERDPDEPDVVVRPSGSGIGIQPFFVEVTNAAILLHRKIDEEPVRIPTASIAGDENFKKLVQDVAAVPNGQLIFLIRGDGVGAYNKAKRVADAADARNAKLPLSGQGKLDLRMFEKFLQ